MSNNILPFASVSSSYFELKSGGDTDSMKLQIGGMSRHLPRLGGLIQLERTGPFVPPLSLPGRGDVVITEDMRSRLESSEFADWTLRPVIKTHIVRIEWSGEVIDPDDQWGEPEEIILESPHDPKCSDEIGELYELELLYRCNVRSKEYNKTWTACELECDDFVGGDLFWGKRPGGKIVLVSWRFRQWLEEQGAAKWLSFIPATIRTRPKKS